MPNDETPSDKLTELAVARLLEAGLIGEERRAALAAKIASGKMNAADWQSELGLATSKSVEV